MRVFGFSKMVVWVVFPPWSGWVFSLVAAGMLVGVVGVCILVSVVFISTSRK